MTQSALPSWDQVQAVLQAREAGNRQQAEALCRETLARFPDHPDLLNLLAILLGEAGSHSEAIERFEQAIALAPGRADFIGNHANALWEQGQAEQAKAQCRRSLQMDPGRAEVHNTLGNILLAEGDTTAAMDAFRRAVQLQPGYAQAHNNLGVAAKTLGHRDEALGCFRQAVALQPDYADAWNHAGIVLQELGRIGEAAAAFSAAFARRGEDPLAVEGLWQTGGHWLAEPAGRNVRLRRFCADDAAFLHACYRDAAFMSQYNRYADRAGTANALTQTLRTLESAHPSWTKSVDWVILRRHGGEAVGLVNLVEIQFKHRRAEFLIGVPGVSDRAGGAGLEATLLAFEFAFHRVGLNKLTAYVYADNESALKSTRAVGFVEEGFLRSHVAADEAGVFLDLYCFGITRHDLLNNERLSRLSLRLLGRDITAAVDAANEPSTAPEGVIT